LTRLPNRRQLYKIWYNQSFKGALSYRRQLGLTSLFMHDLLTRSSETVCIGEAEEGNKKAYLLTRLSEEEHKKACVISS